VIFVVHIRFGFSVTRNSGKNLKNSIVIDMKSSKMLLKTWWVAIIVALCSIITIECNWYVVECKYAEIINRVVENIDIGILSAALFYILSDRIPYYVRKASCVSYIRSVMSDINNNLRWITISIAPLYLGTESDRRATFIKDFSECDLYKPLLGGNTTILESIEEHRNKIRNIAEHLFASYIEYLDPEELRFLKTILNSVLITQQIRPINFSIPEKDRIFMESNQEEFAQNIYHLYLLLSAKP
jgi:hypothetical protein